MTDSDYGNLSTLLSDHQGLLRKGDLVRVLSSGGSWNDHQVHSKGKGCWVNVSDVGGSEPNFSVRLVPGGRWYRISVPGERLAFLEGDTNLTEEDEGHPTDAHGTNTEPTILNNGRFEAGGGLATPGDRDNTDPFYQLIQNPLRDNAEEDLSQTILELQRKHSKSSGIERLENGMQLLLTALSELASIDQADPDSDAKMTQAELKEARLYQFLKDQMTSISQRADINEEGSAILEQDLIAFMEAYRIRKIRVIQALKRARSAQESNVRPALQTPGTSLINDDGEQPFIRAPGTDGGGRKVIIPTYTAMNDGSNMDLDDLDDGYVEAADITQGHARSPADAERIKTLEKKLRLDRECWDRETEKIVQEMQTLRLENEELRKTQARDDTRGAGAGVSDSQQEALAKQLRLVMKRTEDEAANRESFRKGLVDELAGFIETKFKTCGLPTTMASKVSFDGIKTYPPAYPHERDHQQDKTLEALESQLSDIRSRLIGLEERQTGALHIASDPAPQTGDKYMGRLPEPPLVPSHVQEQINSLRDRLNLLSRPTNSTPAKPGILEGDVDRSPLKTNEENSGLRDGRAGPSIPEEVEPGVDFLLLDGRDDMLDVGLYDSPMPNDLPPNESALQGILEELEELSSTIDKLNQATEKVIRNGHDGKVKSHRGTMSTKFERLSELSRRCRNRFKREARSRLGLVRANELINGQSLTRNLTLVAEMEKLLEQLDERIEARGLDLIQTGTAPDIKTVWPTFTGSDLPLVHSFLAEIMTLMVEGGVPVSRRGTILGLSIKGEARTILTNHDFVSRNPSFESQAAVLKDHFGQAGSQISLLTRLHQAQGKIPAVGDENQPVFRIYDAVKGHLKLLRAAKDLQERFDRGEIPENPISSCYLNTVEDFLPRDSVNKLTDVEGYTSTLSTQARFKLIVSSFKSLQTWSSFMIARHGINRTESEPKKKNRPPQTTLVATTNKKAEENKGDRSGGLENPTSPSAPPQFTGSPPMPLAPLYGPPPQMPSTICYYCKKPGHWASNCPEKRNGKMISQTTYNGQTINLEPFSGSQRFFKADLICFICQTLAQTPNPAPSPHIFTKNGRLERFLCPKLVSMASMEERCSTLERSDICLACLNGRLSDHRHSGRICNSLDLPGMHILKCYHVGCKKRWTLCVTHKQDNAQNIANYKRNTQEHLQINLSLITTVTVGDSVAADQGDAEDSVNLNTNLSSLPPRVYSGIQDLVNSSKTPILHINENSYTFMIYLMQGKDEANPVVVCFDTGSAFTLIRQDALENKIQGPTVKLPGSSSVIGIGGKQPADNYYCSVPLDEEEAGGFSSKIISCLSVSQIVEIDTVDTAKLGRYLKRKYQDQLPPDFDLFNFRSLGNRIKLDALIGVQELQIYPKLILQTPCGLCVYKVPIIPAQGASPYCIAGSLPDLSEEDALEEPELVTLVNEVPVDSLNLVELREAWDSNLRDPEFVDIMDDQTRSSMLTVLHSEFDQGPDDHNKRSQPVLVAENPNQRSQNGEEQAKKEARKIKPSFIVSSPLPKKITEAIETLQGLMTSQHPALQPFLVSRPSLHITHLVLGHIENIREFSEKLKQPICKMLPPDGLGVTTGRLIVLNGNICIALSCADLTPIQGLLQQACSDSGTYFDPQQTYHITIFKRDHKRNLQPNIHLDELGKFELPARSFCLEHIDFCRMKRFDKSEYFDIELRLNLLDAPITVDSPIIPITPGARGGAPARTEGVLTEGMTGLCSGHRILLNTSLPLINDWHSIESTEAIIGNIYQPFNEKEAGRATVPNQLLQIQNEGSPALPCHDDNPCLSSNKAREDRARNLLDENVSQFRCLSCKLCSSCSRGNKTGGPTLTLRNEVENLLIKNSVSIDLRTNRIVAKHVLPSNFKELLGDNRKECERRLRTQLQKLAKRPEEERNQVQQSIRKLISRGFVCTKNEFSDEERRAVEENEGPYTLPVSIVFKSSSLSSPSRVCLDGSARTSTGYSLNCLLPKGALSLSIGSLVQVWKGFPVVASGDLSSFYCRFSLDATHWGLQKFLWVDDLDPTGPTTTYYVKTIIFGIRSSGLVCHFGLTKLIEVFDCLKNSVFYVDDCISYFYDLDQAKTEIQKIADVLDKYNLPFKSGGLSLLGQTPSPEVVNDQGEIAISSARWNPVTDRFRCNIPILFLGQTDRGSLAKVRICPGTTAEEIYDWLPDTLTLKDLLSKVASHFDSSLGILTGLIAPMRHLVRKVMIESREDSGQTNWDFVLSAQHRRQFARQLSEAKRVGTFEYPRFPHGTSPIVPNHKGTLICFTDAADFESAVIYLALPQEDGKWRFNLITARCYLVQKGMTIAKSELQAAAHGATATQSVLDNFAGRLSLEPVLLLDSQCTIHWISNCDSLLHTFVRNRVLAIASVFGKNIFYVKSKLNIADDISRESITAQTVSPNSRFYTGPKFLEQGIEAAQLNESLIPLSTISRENMTPELLEVFKSGIILSKFQDLNFMALKKQIKGHEDERVEEDTQCTEAQRCSPPHPPSPNDHTMENSPDPDATPSGVCRPTLSSLNCPGYSGYISPVEINKQITLRNNNHSLDAPRPSYPPTYMSEPNPEPTLYCTICSTTVPKEMTSYFYSQCNPNLGHHAYGYLTEGGGDTLPSSSVSTSLMSSEQPHPVPSCTRGVNQLITTRNMSRNNPMVFPIQQNPAGTPATSEHRTELPEDDDVAPAQPKLVGIDNESGQANQTAPMTDCWSKRTRDLAMEIQYLINPIGYSLPKLCRAGATALRFIHLLLDSLNHKKSGGTWAKVKARIFLDPTCVRRICLTVTGDCPPDLDPTRQLADDPPPGDASVIANYHRAHALNTPSQPQGATANTFQARTLVHKAKHTHYPRKQAVPTLYISGKQIESDGWIKYPGILKARRMTHRWKTLITGEQRDGHPMAYHAILLELEWFQQLIESFRQRNCRPAIQRLGYILSSDLAKITQTNLKHQGFKAASGPRLQLLLQKVAETYSHDCQVMPYSPQVNFVQAMNGSYAQSCYFIGLTFLHLVRQEQKHISAEWTSKKRARYCLSKDGVMVFNTRMSESVSQRNSIISNDPDSIDFSQIIPDFECPVLDKNSPLYISIARFVHFQLDLPVQPLAGLFQKHKGASQNYMSSLRFCYAPGGLAVFKRIQECCFICRVRMKKYVKTSEGDVHHSQLVFVKPFQSSHLDLMGPLLMKVHRSASTRKNPNEKKVWILVIVCSITRAVWTEVMYGTSAADFSDALTRAMSVVGSIMHVVTDRLATQLKVLREGKFLEQIKYSMYKRLGWYFESIPVSRHRWNGLVEGRIASLREMLSFPENRVPMTILNFQTHLRVATSLLNAVPFAHSFEGGTASPELRILSPSAFMYPLNSLHRPLLSPIMVDGSDDGDGYFGTMRDTYQQMVTKFMDAVVPIISKKYHKYYQTPGHELSNGDVVLFKKRPGATFLPGWCLGRVIGVKKSQDQKVRSVQVEYICNRGSDQDGDLYEINTEGKRVQLGNNLSKIETVRESDEMIKLYPIDPQEDDMYKALTEILDASQTTARGQCQ